MTISILFSFTSPAHAACANPEGVAGDQVYNGTYNVMQYCNGTGWVSMKSNSYTQWLQNGNDIYFSSGNVGIGISTPATALHVLGVITAGGAIRLANDTVVQNCETAGDIRYNTTKASVEVCDGSSWKSAANTDGFTQGSIPFAAANGELTENNANLYWDNANNMLRVSDINIKGKALFDGAAGDAPFGFEQFAETLNLDDLNDVAISEAANGQALTYNGTNWENRTLSYGVDDMTDVAVTGASTNDALIYNGTAWVNTPLTLDSLSNVSAAAPSTNHGIIYDGTNWVSQALSLSLMSDVSVAAPSSNDALVYNGTNWAGKQFNLANLGDVSAAAPNTNDMLIFDGTSWVSQALPAAVKSRSMVPGWPDAIICTRSDGYKFFLYAEIINTSLGLTYRRQLSGMASQVFGVTFNTNGTWYSDETGEAYPDCHKSITQLYAEGKAFDLVGGDGTYSVYELADTTITGLAADDVLTYDGVNSAWVNKQFGLDTLSDVVVTNPSASQSLVYDGTNWVNQATISNLDSLSDVAITSVASSDYLTYNGTNWVNAHSSTQSRSMVPGWPDALKCNTASWGDFTMYAMHTPNVSNLYYYRIITAGSANYDLAFNPAGTYNSASTYISASDCANKTITQLYAEGKAFDLVGGDGTYSVYELADTTVSGLAANDVLSYNGSAWINKQFNLDALSDAVITTPANNDSLVFDGTNWVNKAFSNETRSVIPGWPDAIICYNANVGGPTVLWQSYAFGVHYYEPGYSGSGSAHYAVVFNADKTWNSTVTHNFSGCTGKSISQLYAEGKAFDFVGGDGTYSVYELADTTVSGLATNDVLSYNGTAWINKQFNVDALSDAVITTPANNDSLVYNGTNWVNKPFSAETRSVVAGWPDVIKCTSVNSGSSPMILHLNYVPYVPNGIYYYRSVFSGYSDVMYGVAFNANGTWNSDEQWVFTDCHKSITQLYAEGKAFDLVGGDGTYSMYELADTTIAGLAEGDTLTFTDGAWKNKQQWLLNTTNLYYNGGNVGIGTNAPSTALHVVGGARVTGLSTAGVVTNDATGALGTAATLPAENFPALTGAVTTTAGSTVTTIPDNTITAGKLTGGTAGQILTSNGTSAASWQSSGGGASGWSAYSTAVKTSTTSWSTVTGLSITFTLTNAAKVIFIAEGSATLYSYVSDGNTIYEGNPYLRYTIDGVGQGNATYGEKSAIRGVAMGSWTHSGSASLAAGSHTIALQVKDARASTICISYNRCHLQIMAFY